MAQIIGGFVSPSNGEKVASNLNTNNDNKVIDTADYIVLAQIIGGFKSHESLGNQFEIRNSDTEDNFNNSSISIKTGSSYLLDSILIGDIDGSYIP